MNRMSISKLSETAASELLGELVDQLDQHASYFEDFDDGWTDALNIDASSVLLDPTHEDTIDLLEVIIVALDKLDNDDFFGTEGWRSVFGFDD